MFLARLQLPNVICYAIVGGSVCGAVVAGFGASAWLSVIE